MQIYFLLDEKTFERYGDLAAEKYYKDLEERRRREQEREAQWQAEREQRQREKDQYRERNDWKRGSDNYNQKGGG